MKIIDAHSHIDYISHNLQPDVVGTICCATNEADWTVLIDKMRDDKNIYSAFGIHPWFVSDIKAGFESRLENLLRSNDTFMVGEIGVDKYRPGMEKQIYVFQKQLDVAVKLRRSLFLHCVGAWDKILHVLKQYKKSELPIIVAHAFNGSGEISRNLIRDYNVLFSFGKIDKDQEINRIQQIPINKILVESDAKNDVVLSDIVDKISNIKKEPNAANIIYNNTLKVLNNG